MRGLRIKINNNANMLNIKRLGSSKNIFVVSLKSFYISAYSCATLGRYAISLFPAPVAPAFFT